MKTSMRQRILSFLLAMFFFGSSVVAVFFTVRQIREDNKANDLASKLQTPAPTPMCQVSSALASKAGDDPGEIQKVTDNVTSLQSTDIKQGDGAAAALGDCITVHYRLYLADGTPVENNDTFTTGKPVAFRLSEGGLIKGWTQGIPGMKVGGMRHLVLPSDLGYGTAGSCKSTGYDSNNKCTSYAIPPNAVIVFDVQLLDVQH